MRPPYRPKRAISPCIFCGARFSTTAGRLARKQSKLLPDSPARTRFAPSPTGYLHLGSLRTALFNYLLSKRTGGKFLLRIEDTDQKRIVPGSEQRLYEDLQWAGLLWDEGPIVGGLYGPYKQSERTSLGIYGQEISKLISAKHAYRCFCSQERLDTLARHRNDLGLPPGYDGACREISPEEAEERAHNGELNVVRLRVTGPFPIFTDLVFGKIGQNQTAGAGRLSSQQSDPILLKSDGYPTYHLANVIDDHYMKISHVIRGTEWMASTPLHVALYNAFGWEPPAFGHVPLLTEKSGQKLSKRNVDIDISFFRDKEEVFPEALNNFAALLGWSHSRKSDIFSLKDLEQIFDLKLTKGNTVVSFEKLWFLQSAHAQRYATEGGPEAKSMVDRIEKAVRAQFTDEQLSPLLKNHTLDERIASIIREGGARGYTNAAKFIENNRPFFTSFLNRPPYNPTTPSPPQEKSQPKSETETSSAIPPTTTPIAALHTAAAALCLVPVEHWTTETHKQNISYLVGDSSYSSQLASFSPSSPSFPTQTQTPSTPAFASEKQFRKDLYHYLRWALCGGAPGISIPATMAILGRDECVRRLLEAKELTTPLQHESENLAGGQGGKLQGGILS
ncbi:glutamyl-tRNA synthetase [Histoplasma capsulatum G186AR]|uniref:Glutamate--tRNA ligase, mitochondrial n=2 Tax=Ajellomyces capsulatus TaxID=5037 RepID=C0NWL7_AJECG|nr:glutamyl-tRNA synthetase [Histoplasma capsulatum G186AR]EEH04322.1 glutamyl-tRNA synthetase [Histoplasma capsulatum G186AR]KAG5291281.1 glutamyl-tRNA synthetase [Histoplasma capsulatum]QSS68584.1 glutamyl-tRNA synthetase [Histoplasma capsulatum G186AR]